MHICSFQDTQNDQQFIVSFPPQTKQKMKLQLFFSVFYGKLENFAGIFADIVILLI